jgi:hypothetical protein
MNRRYAAYLKPAALAAAVAMSAAGAAVAADMPVKAAPAPAPFFLVNDTWVSFTWYPTATDPGVSLNNIVGQTDKFSKYVGTVSHFDVWAYGTNFFNLDFLQSQGGGHDPIQGIVNPSAQGAVEVYGFARSTLGFNEILGTKMFSTYFTKDISFEWGGDANTENNFLAPEKKDIVLGAQFTLNLPGTVNLAVLAYKEWNHNTFWASEQTLAGTQPGVFTFTGTCSNIVGPPINCFNGDRDFRWIPRIELGIIEPLTFIPGIPLAWQGITAINFPKGTGISTANLVAIGGTLGPGSGPFTADNASAFTKVEVFEDNRINFDYSKYFWNKANVVSLYVGYRYWYNKFGTDHNAPIFSIAAPSSSIESTFYTGISYHFN